MSIYDILTCIVWSVYTVNSHRILALQTRGSFAHNTMFMHTIDYDVGIFSNETIALPYHSYFCIHQSNIR